VLKESYEKPEDLALNMFLRVFTTNQVQNNDTETQVTLPNLVKEEMNVLVENLHKLSFMTHGLYGYLVSDVLYNYAITSFAMYLEATSSDNKFMDEVKKAENQNLDNRKFTNMLQLIENLFDKRNNGKGTSSVAMLEYCYYLNSWKDDLAALKTALKDMFNCEFNQSLKSTLNNTKFVSQMYLSQASVFFKFNAQTAAIVENMLERLSELTNVLNEKGVTSLNSLVEGLKGSLGVSAYSKSSNYLNVELVTKFK